MLFSEAIAASLPRATLALANMQTGKPINMGTEKNGN
jgi:hypothetical protein